MDEIANCRQINVSTRIHTVHVVHGQVGGLDIDLNITTGTRKAVDSHCIRFHYDNGAIGHNIERIDRSIDRNRSGNRSAHPRSIINGECGPGNIRCQITIILDIPATDQAEVDCGAGGGFTNRQVSGSQYFDVDETVARICRTQEDVISFLNNDIAGAVGIGIDDIGNRVDIDAICRRHSHDRTSNVAGATHRASRIDRHISRTGIDYIGQSEIAASRQDHIAAVGNNAALPIVRQDFKIVGILEGYRTIRGNRQPVHIIANLIGVYKRADRHANVISCDRAGRLKHSAASGIELNIAITGVHIRAQNHAAGCIEID